MIPVRPGALPFLELLRSYQASALGQLRAEERFFLLGTEQIDPGGIHLDTGGGCIFCGLRLIDPPKRDVHLESHVVTRPTIGDALVGRLTGAIEPCPAVVVPPRPREVGQGDLAGRRKMTDHPFKLLAGTSTICSLCGAPKSLHEPLRPLSTESPEQRSARIAKIAAARMTAGFSTPRREVAPGVLNPDACPSAGRRQN
jgi:hypothetical protein